MKKCNSTYYIPLIMEQDFMDCDRGENSLI